MRNICKERGGCQIPLKGSSNIAFLGSCRENRDTFDIWRRNKQTRVQASFGQAWSQRSTKTPLLKNGVNAPTLNSPRDSTRDLGSIIFLRRLGSCGCCYMVIWPQVGRQEDLPERLKLLIDLCTHPPRRKSTLPFSSPKGELYTSREEGKGLYLLP